MGCRLAGGKWVWRKELSRGASGHAYACKIRASLRL